MQTKEKRQVVYNSVMEILSKLPNNDNIKVSVQYQIVLDEKKIAVDAARIAPKLIGKPCQYATTNEIFNLTTEPMDGRIVESDGKYYFMKKRARTRGYLLDNKEILKIFWDMEKAG